MIVLGIAGGSGSGKSCISQAILQKVGTNNAAVIQHDCYYKNRETLSLEERKNLNYDHPDALETDLMVQHIKDLKSGKSVSTPIYDFSRHMRSKDTVKIESKPVIVVEGILLLHYPEVRELLDIKVFIDTEADVRFIRRLKRDTKERGREMNNVIDQYLTTVKPMHRKFVEPSKVYADMIIPEGGYHSVVAIDLLCAKLTLTVMNDKKEGESQKLEEI